jgi:glycosyltransferase involved in cell wall biosynthesis
MIAYFFPTVGGIVAAGWQRTLKFAKYLLQNRWEPVILTVREGCYESYLTLDPTLLQRVPGEITVVRTGVIRWLTKLLQAKNAFRSKPGGQETKLQPHAGSAQEVEASETSGWYQTLKNGFTDLFEIPDAEIGWFLPAFTTGWRVIKSENVDTIYATGKPWTAHLVGVALKKITGKPLVVDFRDPWLTNPFRKAASTFRDRVEAYLERKVIEKADVVITNTLALKEEFVARFPRQAPGKFVALLNGFDPDDFAGAPKTHSHRAKKFTVMHTGFLYGKRDPRLFLEAVRRLVETQRVDSEKMKISLIGSVDLTYDLAEYLRSHRLDEIITLVNHVPYQTSIEYLRDADVLLLLQPGTTTQVPSKLFEYIALGRPILAICPHGGATAQLVVEESLGVTAEADCIEEIASALEALYRDWQHGAKARDGIGQTREKFNVKNLTAILARKFDQMVAADTDVKSRRDA